MIMALYDVFLLQNATEIRISLEKFFVSQVIVADPWKAGSSNQTGSGRKVNENKLLTSKKNRFNPYQDKFDKCRLCKSVVHQPNSKYCQECAYKKGICAMCGVKILKTKDYKQSSC